MLSNLPIGVYVPGRTVVHQLRARTKLLILAWLACLFFAANRHYFHYATYAVAFALLLAALLLARVDLGYVWRRMRFLAILLLIGVPFSLAWTPGETWRTVGPAYVTIHGYTVPLGPLVITYDGLWFTSSFSAIFLLLFLGSMALTLTTTPVALAEGVMLLLKPLRRLGLPVEEFGLMTLVALRFIPVLVQETEQLIKAQMSRGADFTTGSLAQRARRLGTLLVPLVQGALRRAEGLSAALEARGYGVTSEATLLHEGHLRPLDWLVLLAVPALTALTYVRL